MSLVLRALEGFNKLPRDIRIYVLAPMLNNVDFAACYLAVSCKEPSDEFVQRAVARGCYDPNWRATHKYAVICGAAEAGNEELFWGLARKRNYDNVIMQACHPNIWNTLVGKVCINMVTLLFNRVRLGYALTNCKLVHHVLHYVDQTIAQRLICESHACMRKSTVDWLRLNDIPAYWIMTAVINLDDDDLAAHMLHTGAMTVWYICSMYNNGDFSNVMETPKLYQWSHSVVKESQKSFDGM
jgi:hypothetical protein